MVKLQVPIIEGMSYGEELTVLWAVAAVDRGRGCCRGCPLTHPRGMWDSSQCGRVASGGLISYDRVAASRPTWLPVNAAAPHARSLLGWVGSQLPSVSSPEPRQTARSQWVSLLVPGGWSHRHVGLYPNLKPDGQMTIDLRPHSMAPTPCGLLLLNWTNIYGEKCTKRQFHEAHWGYC